MYLKIVFGNLLNDHVHIGNIFIASVLAIKFPKYHISFIIHEEVGKIIIMLFHRNAHTLFVLYQFQIGIEQQRSKYKILGVFAVDLKDKDLFLIITEDRCIDLVIGSPSDPGSI